jgi:hypothetical protein
MSKTFTNSRDPVVIALWALRFLACDPARLERFLALSGIAPETLRERAGEAEVQAAVLDHILADESLLFLFCEAEGLPPTAPAAARRALPGGDLAG